MANEVKRYLHDGMELPFEDWSKTLHSFNDLASIVLLMMLHNRPQ